MTAFSPLLIVILLQAGFIMSPGADFALVFRTVGKKGHSAGVVTALGIGGGCLTLLLLSIIGLNTLLSTLPALNIIIRYVGAVWLIWQAILSFWPHLSEQKEGKRKASPFVLGFLNHTLNIEVILFYVVVMSQLSVHHVSQGLQLLAALEMSVFTVLWFGFLSFITGMIPNNERILNHLVTRIVIGGLFLVSAVGLITAGGFLLPV